MASIAPITVTITKVRGRAWLALVGKLIGAGVVPRHRWRQRLAVWAVRRIRVDLTAEPGPRVNSIRYDARWDGDKLVWWERRPC